MNRLYFIIAFCLFGTALAAQKWRLSGRVSDETGAGLTGVSIYVDGQFVAATDGSGQFSVAQDARPVEINVRYLGYFPQRAVLSENDFRQFQARYDFVLVSQSPVLQEVTISAKPIEAILKENFTTDLYDFGFVGKNLLLLMREKKRFYLRLSEEDGTVLSQIQFPENCHVLHQSCVGNFHVVGENFAWEIALKGQKIDTFARYPVKSFHQFVQPCVQESAGRYYFLQHGLLNQTLRYLAFEADQEPRVVFEISDEQGLEMAQLAVDDFFAGKPFIFRTAARASAPPHEFEMFKPWGKTGELSSVEGLLALSGYGDDQIYRISELENIRRDSVYAPMLKIHDTLCLFDHTRNRIVRFGPKLERTDVVSTFYHLEKNWGKLLLQDVANNRVFALFYGQGGIVLKEINPRNGKVGKSFELSLAPYVSEKFRMRNGLLYFIGQPDVNVPNKILYKMNIFAGSKQP